MLLGLPEDFEIFHCFLCRQFHDLQDNRCPFVWLIKLRRFLVFIANHSFDWYIRAATILMVIAFTVLMIIAALP
jgi:hypothetical protein